MHIIAVAKQRAQLARCPAQNRTFRSGQAENGLKANGQPGKRISVPRCAKAIVSANPAATGQKYGFVRTVPVAQALLPVEMW